MEMQLILLYAMPYRMVDDKTGEITNSGVTVYGYDRTNFNPCEKVRGSFTAKGRKPSKFNCPFEFTSKIKQVPGVYEVEVEMESNKDLKAQLDIVDINFVGALKTEIVKQQPQTGK